MFSMSFRSSASKIKDIFGKLTCNYSILKCHLGTKPYSVKSAYRKSVVLNPQHIIKRRVHDDQPQEDFYKVLDMDSITKGDDELLKKLKVIFLEVEIMRQDGEKVPGKMSDEKWKELLSLPSRSQRAKLLGFWWRNEKIRIKDKQKKVEARLERENSLKDIEENETDHIVYGFRGSTIFIRVYETVMDNQLNNKLIQAMRFGENLIVDCSYDDHMTLKEASLCAKQLTVLFAENRHHKDPFNIHFCNADPESKLIQKWKKYIPTLYDDAYPLNVTNEHYFNFFPKEKLVYLTPHCREELSNYNPDDVYIIGAMVDKVNNEPLSLAKAKSQGLRMAKFPLDKYLDWHIGSKSLTLDQVLKIMLDLKVSRNWLRALRHVPMRKLKPESRQSFLYQGSRYDSVTLPRKRTDLRVKRKALMDEDE